jgi:hypothetical protein
VSTNILTFTTMTQGGGVCGAKKAKYWIATLERPFASSGLRLAMTEEGSGFARLEVECTRSAMTAGEGVSYKMQL